MNELAARDLTTTSRASRMPVVQADVARSVLFAGLFVLALVPVATTPIPAMVDYVNHLARMYELAGQGLPQASAFYHADWRLYPDLAMDLIVPALARMTGVECATRLFLLASQILVVTGSMAIERRIKGRTHIAGFIALLYLYNPPFAWGFLNFEAALGVALWGIAAWLAVREMPWPMRLGVHTVFVVVLFAGHMFALGLYGATLGLHELWSFSRDRRPLRQLIGTGILLGAPAVALIVCMLVSGGSVGGSINRWMLLGKLLWPFLLLDGYNAPLAFAGTLMAGAGVYALKRRGDIAFLSSGAFIAAGFAVIYVAIPERMFDTAFADVRVLVGAALILPAFVSVTFKEPRAARFAAILVAGLTIANLAEVETVWQIYRPVYRDMIASFAAIPAGAHVLVAHTGEVDDPPLAHLADYPLYHAPTLAVPLAGAFVPTLFTTRGKQPLVVSTSLERLSFSCGGPVPLRLLRAIAEGKSARPSFMSDWTRDFDFVYALGPDTREPLPQALELVEKHAQFTLYRVHHPAERDRRIAGITGRSSP